MIQPVISDVIISLSDVRPDGTCRAVVTYRLMRSITMTVSNELAKDKEWLDMIVGHRVQRDASKYVETHP